MMPSPKGSPPPPDFETSGRFNKFIDPLFSGIPPPQNGHTGSDNFLTFWVVTSPKVHIYLEHGDLNKSELKYDPLSSHLGLYAVISDLVCGNCILIFEHWTWPYITHTQHVVPFLRPISLFFCWSANFGPQMRPLIYYPWSLTLTLIHLFTCFGSGKENIAVSFRAWGQHFFFHKKNIGVVPTIAHSDLTESRSPVLKFSE